MEWIRQIAVDLLALIIIAVAVIYEQTVLSYIVYIYTSLIALARLFSLYSDNFRAVTEKKVSEAPIWVYHLIYAASSAILLYGRWYITAAGWLFIWAAAVIVQRKKV